MILRIRNIEAQKKIKIKTISKKQSILVIYILCRLKTKFSKQFMVNLEKVWTVIYKQNIHERILTFFF